MSDEVNKILEDHHAAMIAYAELAQNGDSTQAQLNAAAAAVRDLGQQLSGAISAGATPCGNCQAAPIGMLKTPAYFNQGVEVPAMFEVGCVFCAPFLVANELRGGRLLIDGESKRVVRRSYSARATDPVEAVRKWNAGEWVEDTFFDRIPGFTPVAAPETE